MTETRSEPKPSPFRSDYTTSFPKLLNELGISVLVTTYQAGQMIVLRDDGGRLNTHFVRFRKPMGMAVSPARIAVGTAREVHDYFNMPAVTGKLEPEGKHDACFLPRNVHVTGDIDIHEMAWDKGGELWCVNTRFSCLCNLEIVNSFVPRWRPPFVTALAAEDRCHLNGLGMVDGEPRFVTALGESDTKQGWRENKATGGVLMDLTTNRFVCRGLSMPHSPRWYAGKLWVLESGKGGIATVDPASGEVTTLAELPGFTRGLGFCGPLAFVGLSQVRETAMFSGIPIVDRQEERISGVWVVHIESGNTVAFLRFKEAVQEIFAVQVLPNIRFPEILEPGHELIASSYTVPDEALKDVPKPMRSH